MYTGSIPVGASSIRDVAAGGSTIDANVVEALLVARGRSGSLLSDLSPREVEVLAEAAQGRSNARIPESLTPAAFLWSLLDGHLDAVGAVRPRGRRGLASRPQHTRQH